MVPIKRAQGQHFHGKRNFPIFLTLSCFSPFFRKQNRSKIDFENYSSSSKMNLDHWLESPSIFYLVFGAEMENFSAKLVQLSQINLPYLFLHDHRRGQKIQGQIQVPTQKIASFFRSKFLILYRILLIFSRAFPVVIFLSKLNKDVYLKPLNQSLLLRLNQYLSLSSFQKFIELCISESQCIN